MILSLRLPNLLALLLAAVLVMTQTLGLVHSITHGPSGLLLQSHADNPHHDLDHELHHDLHHHIHGHHHFADAHAKDAADTAADTAAAPGDFLSSLFPYHQDASDCRLYDQASQAGALLAVLPLTLPVVLPPSAVAIFQGEALARWAALFDARGPPLTV